MSLARGSEWEEVQLLNKVLLEYIRDENETKRKTKNQKPGKEQCPRTKA